MYLCTMVKNNFASSFFTWLKSNSNQTKKKPKVEAQEVRMVNSVVHLYTNHCTFETEFWQEIMI